MPTKTRILLTPTARLARNLARQQALEMTTGGRTAWLPTPVYSFPAWLSRLRDQYLLHVEDHRTPISAQQAQLLWQSLIEPEVFVGEPQVAGLALQSWRTLHEYWLEGPEHWPELLLSEDSRRFQKWAGAYKEECVRRGLIDEWAFAAEIPALIAAGEFEIPDSIALAGFDLPMPPLQAQIIHAFDQAGAQITRVNEGRGAAVAPEIFRFAEPDDELYGAAVWARGLVKQDADQSIAIVVPDLHGRVDRVDRVFREVFDPPGFSLHTSGPEPWHISLGKALSEWPVAADALAILSLPEHRLSQPQASSLLRSPYLSGWLDENMARSQTMAQLARRAPYNLTLNELTWALQQTGANTLAGKLTAWSQARDEPGVRAWPSQWSGRFQEELSCLGFGYGRMLDSREHQILQRWHGLLETFGALDLIIDAPVLRSQALQLLRERAAGTVFRERNTGVPVEVLGVQEALGSRFDAIWITTLDSDTWPGSAQRDALIPASVQATVPRATSDGCLAQAELELTGLLGSASAARGSFAQGSDEAPAELTALLARCPVQSIQPKPPPAPAEMAPVLHDEHAPELTTIQVKGGTGVLRDQSRCPFRAFAERRLNAIDLTPPRPGLDAGQRGSIVHKALEKFWTGLAGSAQLRTLSENEQKHNITAAVQDALDDFTNEYRLTLTAAGRLLEQRRTERVLARWLNNVERERPAFTVKGHERDLSLDLGAFQLNGKIDRMDHMENGTVMLIDYKTGRTGKGGWFPEPRISDPQLPAYAMALDPRPDAIAFARIRPDDLRFDGLSRMETGTAGVTPIAEERYKFKAIESWNELLNEWQAHLFALARDFADGKAAVHPASPQDCKFCHLHALCRIQERAPYDAMNEEAEDGE